MHELDSWSSLLRAILATSLVFYVAKNIGELLAGRPSSIHLQTIIGINVIGLVALVFGFLPQPVPLFSLGLVCLAFLVRDFSRAFTKEQSPEDARRQNNSKQKLKPTSTKKSIGTINFAWLFLMGSLGITLGPALTFPSGWDELTYHITLPQRWSAAQSISVQSDLPYSALPSLSELVSWIVQPVEALVTPRLITWAIWVEGLLIFLHTAKRICSSANSFVITWVLAVSPVLLMISANCYVEAFIWADSAAMCSLLIRGNSNCSLLPESGKTIPREVLLVGILMGGAIATKITSLGLIVLPIFCWLSNCVWLSRSSLAKSALPMRIASCLIVASLFALPFYLRPWILCGNPLSPYFASWFTTDPATIQSSSYHHELAVGNFGLHGALGLVASPFAISFANELYDGSFGMQWFVLLGLATLGATKWRTADQSHRHTAVALLLVCFVLYLLWFLTAQQARFAIPAFTLATLAAMVGIEKLDSTWQRIARVALLLTALISVPWTNLGYYLDSWLCAAKVRAPVDYILDGVGDSYAELATHLHLNSQPTDKMISLFEHRLAYLPSTVEIATPYFQTKYFQNPTNQTADEILDELKQHEVSHVIFAINPVGPDLSPQRFELQRTWFRGIDECIAKGHLRLVWKSEHHAIVEVVN